MHEITLEEKLCIVSVDTLQVLFEKWWSDAVSLYMFYYKQCKIQKTNLSRSTDYFCMQWLERWKVRLKKAKAVIISLWLIKIVKKRKKDGTYLKSYIKMNYIRSQAKNDHVVWNAQVDECTGGWQTTNALSDINVNALSDIKINKDFLFSEFWKLYPNKKWKNISETRYKKNITKQLHKEIMQWVKGYIRDTEQSKSKWLFTPAYKQWSTFLNQKSRKDYEITKQEAFTEAYNQSDATIYSWRCKDNIGESRSLDLEYVKPYNDLKTAINMKSTDWWWYDDFISKYL